MLPSLYKFRFISFPHVGLNVHISKILQFYIAAYREKLEAFLLRSMESGLISDGVLAQDMNQASSFWRIREVPFSNSINFTSVVLLFYLLLLPLVSVTFDPEMNAYYL